MPRDYSPEELETVRLTELQEAAKGSPIQRAAATTMQPQEGQVKLYDPEHEALKYGPGSGPETTDQLIVFGMVEPHVAIVRADHPYLPGLLREFSSIVVLRPGEIPGRTYACDVCDEEFPSKALIATHRKEAHRKKASAATDDGA